MRFHTCIKTYHCITHHLVKNLILFKVQELTLCTCAVGIRHGHPRNVEVITSNFTFPGYHSADSSTNDSHLEYYILTVSHDCCTMTSAADFCLPGKSPNQLFYSSSQVYSVETYSCTNASEPIKLSSSSCGLKNSIH